MRRGEAQLTSCIRPSLELLGHMEKQQLQLGYLDFDQAFSDLSYAIGEMIDVINMRSIKLVNT